MITRQLRPEEGKRYFHIVAMIFIATLFVSNTVAVKITQLGPFSLPAGIIVFPISYLFGDVLTEVYGFRRTRSIIWTGFFCLAGMSLLYYIATILPAAAFWKDQAAFERLFGLVPRITASSFCAYLVGEYVNSVVMSKLKVRTEGKHLWLRAVGSTFAGEGVDSFVFNSLAFYGVFPIQDVAVIMVSGFLLKSLYEIVALPFTYWMVGWLKNAEGVDVYDRGISYKFVADTKESQERSEVSAHA